MDENLDVVRWSLVGWILYGYVYTDSQPSWTSCINEVLYGWGTCMDVDVHDGSTCIWGSLVGSIMWTIFRYTKMNIFRRAYEIILKWFF